MRARPSRSPPLRRRGALPLLALLWQLGCAEDALPEPALPRPEVPAPTLENSVSRVLDAGRDAGRSDAGSIDAGSFLLDAEVDDAAEGDADLADALILDPPANAQTRVFEASPRAAPLT